MDTKPLTPSVDRKFVTEPQIVKLTTAFGAAIRKASPFSDEAQEIIENEWDLIKDELIAANEGVIRVHLDRKRNTITFRVKVKRGLTGQQVLKATGRAIYKDDAAVESMPLIAGSGEEEVEFVFFKPGRRLSDAEVEQERHKRGLVRDLAAQAQANADHPEFADDHWNGDSWLDADGKWSFASFRRDVDGERYVHVYRSGDDWHDDRWFGGRKVPK